MARSRRLLLAAAGASALPLAVACNDLIGLSDFNRAECSGGGLCTDAGGYDVVTPVSDTGTNDANVPVADASGTNPVRWARFKMPNYGDAGDNLQGPTTYASAGDGGVVDTITNLTWNEPAPSDAKSYADAKAFCAALPAVQGKSWRIPSRIELVTLLDLEKAPKIESSWFKSTKAVEYWTASEVRPDDGVGRAYWTVDFNKGGLSSQYAAPGTAAVRCILGGAQ